MADPQLAHRRAFAEVGDAGGAFRVLNPPFRMSERPSRPDPMSPPSASTPQSCSRKSATPRPRSPHSTAASCAPGSSRGSTFANANHTSGRASQSVIEHRQGLGPRLGETGAALTAELVRRRIPPSRQLRRSSSLEMSSAMIRWPHAFFRKGRNGQSLPRPTSAAAARSLRSAVGWQQ
jgi:hypothetical protein